MLCDDRSQFMSWNISKISSENVCINSQKFKLIEYAINKGFMSQQMCCILNYCPYCNCC